MNNTFCISVIACHVMLYRIHLAIGGIKHTLPCGGITHLVIWETSPPCFVGESKALPHIGESIHLTMCRNQTHLAIGNTPTSTCGRNQTHLAMRWNQTHLTMRRWKGFCKDLTSMGLYARRDTAITWRLIYIWAQWVQSLDYLTTHTSLSPIQRGFAPCFVNYKKGCTQLAATSDKVY